MQTPRSVEKEGQEVLQTRAEVPLQPVVPAMVKQLPLQPMEGHRYAKIHLQPMEDPRPEQEFVLSEVTSPAKQFGVSHLVEVGNCRRFGVSQPVEVESCRRFLQWTCTKNTKCFLNNGEDGEKNMCILFRRGGRFCNVYCQRERYCSSPGLSGFVESEEYNPENLDIRFDVASVLKELKRGKRLVCNFCRKKGATVGCEERACRRSYHYFCALCDDAAIETDQVNGVYRVFCPKHDPGNRTDHYGSANKKRRYTLASPTITEEMKTEEKAEENHLQILKRKNNRHKVHIDLVRKCKQAGLLDNIFEEMLDMLHLAQEKLMDDNTSETEYEETVMALFDCGLFENILTNIHSGTEEKIQELLENRKRLDHKIELLQDLKEVLPTPESTASTSSTVSE